LLGLTSAKISPDGSIRLTMAQTCYLRTGTKAILLEGAQLGVRSDGKFAVIAGLAERTDGGSFYYNIATPGNDGPAAGGKLAVGMKVESKYAFYSKRSY